VNDPKKASRPGERTARETDGTTLDFDILLAKARQVDTVRGCPHLISVRGTIDLLAYGDGDALIMIDTRQIVGEPRRIERTDGPERCEVTVALPFEARIDIDASLDTVQAALAKARRQP